MSNFPNTSYTEKMAYYNQNQLYNFYRVPNGVPVPFPPHFIPHVFPAGLTHPSFYNNYRESLPNFQHIPRPLNPINSQTPQTNINRRKSLKSVKSESNKTVKVKREAVVESPEVPPRIPVPFVFTDKERSDCINNLKAEQDLYDLFEDIPNTNPKM